MGFTGFSSGKLWFLGVFSSFRAGSGLFRVSGCSAFAYWRFRASELYRFRASGFRVFVF